MQKERGRGKGIGVVAIVAAEKDVTAGAVPLCRIRLTEGSAEAVRVMDTWKPIAQRPIRSSKAQGAKAEGARRAAAR